MTYEEKYELYKQAITKFGKENQICMAVEEVGELLSAINKFKRGRATEHDVITEIADVIIMAEQLSIIWGSGNVEAEKERKLLRLKERVLYNK
jgi:NTP pyrophosphatase (non-canonical NTP hydrolase)